MRLDRSAAIFLCSLAPVALVSAPVSADAPTTVVCVGSTTLHAPKNYSAAGSGPVTVERWDFTGVQDFCLRDGSGVEAEIAGDLTLTTHADGSGIVVVHYSLAVTDGTLKGTVLTHYSPTSFDSRVHAFGGTGVLSGVSGEGTTIPTGPNTFADQMEYRYR
jgi:hypothetical protein